MPFAREYGLVPPLQAEESGIMGKGRDQRCCSGRLEEKELGQFQGIAGIPLGPGEGVHG